MCQKRTGRVDVEYDPPIRLVHYRAQRSGKLGVHRGVVLQRTGHLVCSVSMLSSLEQSFI